MSALDSSSLPPFVSSYDQAYLVQTLNEVTAELRGKEPETPPTHNGDRAYVAHLENEVRRLRSLVSEQAKNSVQRVAPPLFTTAPKVGDVQRMAAETIYGHVGPSLRDHERSDRSGGYLYVARSFDGLTKLGVSKNPARRFKDARAWNPSLHVLAVLETADMFGVELALHKRYAASRVAREWFRLTDEETLQVLYD